MTFNFIMTKMFDVHGTIAFPWIMINKKDKKEEKERREEEVMEEEWGEREEEERKENWVTKVMRSSEPWRN